MFRLYRNLPKRLGRGYKCPGDVLSDHARGFYRTFLSKTRLFVGLRHPVLCSRASTTSGCKTLRVTTLCPVPTLWWACAVRPPSAFVRTEETLPIKHAKASTRPFTPLEQQLTTWYRKYSFGPSDIKPVPNEILMYEVNQLGDGDEARRNQLR
jgi:hypothetical protein